MQHAVRNKLLYIKKGAGNKHSKEYVELDKNYNYLRSFIGAKQENKLLGYSNDSIQKCERGIILTTHDKIYISKDDYIGNSKKIIKQKHESKHYKYLKLNKERIKWKK